MIYLPDMITIRRLAAASFVLALSYANRAEAQPVRPSPDQAAALLQARPELVTQLRQRLMSSGLSPEQVRARLKAEGYPENLLDPYLSGTGTGGGAPSSAVLAAVQKLGLVDVEDAASLTSLSAGARTVKAAPVTDPNATSASATGSSPLSAASAVIFGLDVFRQTSSLFDANLNGPVDAGYRLGPGDELVLILTGDVELAHTLEVTRNGFVVIPQVGQIGVANLTLAQLEDVLYARLGRAYSGIQRGEGATTRFSVTVSRLRSNQVFVVGDVVSPGAYRISSAGTALSALYAAGGPSDRGSLRRVEIRRAGRTVATLDVYQYLLRGDASQDVRLQQGDVLFVPLHGPRVRVDGELVRPATYELREGERLADVLLAAGGFQATAATQRLLVERVLPATVRTGLGANRVSIDVPLGANGTAPTFAMADGDIVRVARIDDRVRDRIAVNGHVWNPGQQGFSAGLTLEQALRRAGGVKPDAYLGRVLVTRLNADSTRTQLRVMLRDTTGATMEPFPLQADDEITTFSRTGFRAEQYVVIAGAVQKGGRFPYRDGMTLRDLALLAGGITDFADLRQAEIARRPDTSSTLVLSETVRIPLDSGYLFAEGRVPVAGTRDLVLKPYDNVLIFADPGRRAPQVVRVTGEVQYPGTYTLRTRSEQLSSLIERAGGITGQGDAGAAYLSRRLDTQAAVKQLLADSAASDAARLDDAGSRIRVGVDLARALARADSRDNLFLESGDSLHIPARQQIVTVRGEVHVPTALVASGQRLGAYIKAGGGATDAANGRRAYVIQPNGKIESRTRLFWLITLDPTPRPGATVVVPAKGERTGSSSVLQTLSLVAQTMATLVAAIAITR